MASPAAGDFAIASVADAAWVGTVTHVVLTASSGTWVPPTGIQYAMVELVGGGGGGGGCTGAGTGLSVGGSGGGGGYCRKLYAASDLTLAGESYAVGPGGAGGNVGGGGSGTATTFKGLTGSGGSGGSAMTSNTTSQTAGAGAGGAATGGDINIPGDTGNLGRTISGANLFTSRGGRSQLGPSTPATVSTGGAGTAASGYGSGGSGATADTTNRAGGAGANGVILITCYI